MKYHIWKHVSALMLVAVMAFSLVGVEPVLASVTTLTVTNTNNSGDGSLRDAIASASSGNTITFDPSLSGGTITLTSTLTIDKDLTIDGSALASQITISGGDAVRVFYINSGVAASLNSFRITGGEHTPGSSGDGGAGIRNDGTLIIANSALSGNNSNAWGGAVFNTGTLTVNNSTISGNITATFGGGIFNDGSVTVTNSTIAGNSGSHGGGIFNNGSRTLTMANSTIANNTATGAGGGIYNNSDALTTITNSTFSGNSSPAGGGLVNWSIIATVKNTIIANSVGAPNCHATGVAFAVGSANNLADDSSCDAFTNSSSILLGTLGSYGGPTQTIPLLTGSSAVDAGDNDVCKAAPINNLDQRGFTRPSGAHCDIGAYEFQPTAAAPAATTNTASLVTSSGATLNGTVNANNDSSTVTFEYGLTTGYGTTVTADQSPVTGTTDTAVSKAVTGLMPNATYHYRVLAVNSEGTTHGGDQTFSTTAIAPTATTNAASAVTASGATLNGTVNANNDDTTVTFEYGLDTNYDEDTDTADQSPVTDATNTAVSKTITGLTPNTTYHYRVVAVNTTGKTNGADQTFTTATNSAPTDIALSNNSVAEHQSSGTSVGTLTTTDSDTGDTFTYSLDCASPGADDSSFHISDDQLLTNEYFDYATKNVYYICVRVRDSAAAKFDKNFTIHVTHFNEAPIYLGLSSNIIAENNAVNAVIGTLSANDPNAGDTFTYSLTCSTPGGNEASFNVNSNKLRASVAFDYETKSYFQICIRVTDSGGLTFDQPFTIGIRNLDDTPTSLDPTFGVGGKTTVGFNTYLHGKVTAKFNSNSYAYATAVQADGKIVMAGVSNENFALARFNSDGSPDTSFGYNGMVSTDFGGSDAAYATAIQSDGKIVAAGSTYQSGQQKFALARYNSDGSLDATFGANGTVTTDIGGHDDAGNAIVIQPDGKIIVAGYSNNATTYYDFALARYNSDGSLDNTFGTGGKATTDFAGDYDEGYAVALQSNGKIVMAGYSYNAVTSSDFALARYNSDGTLDASFGTGGQLTTSFGDNSAANAILVQPGGHIVAAGSTGAYATNTWDFAVARYNSSGVLDTSFGTNGKVDTNFGGKDEAGMALVLQAGTKFVVAGSSDRKFAVARFDTSIVSSTKDITAFSFTSPATTGVITGTNIAVSVPFGTDVTSLVANFTNTGASVKVGSTAQESGVTTNNFTYPVTYTVIAANGTTQNYVVTVTHTASTMYKLFLPLLLR